MAVRKEQLPFVHQSGHTYHFSLRNPHISFHKNSGAFERILVMVIEVWVLKLPHSTSKSFSVNINWQVATGHGTCVIIILFFTFPFLISNSQLFNIHMFFQEYVYRKIDFW